jgi:hypothetical protein
MMSQIFGFALLALVAMTSSELVRPRQKRIDLENHVEEIFGPGMKLSHLSPIYA